jgi:glyoxylase-like metal-dependent hydrolase (beta-lactamase superfamily II)
MRKRDISKMSELTERKRSMFVKPLSVGFLKTNCYLVACEKTANAMVIDPGFEETKAERILEEIHSRGLKVKHLVNTHGHLDHISGNGILKQATGAAILIHENDAQMLTDRRKNLSNMSGLNVVSPPADRLLHDGDIIRIGLLELRVIHTPGHSSGSISLYCESEGIVFTGDTLFARSIGRTDLPGSSPDEIGRSLAKLMTLPESTIVYPGHGERTTIGTEKAENPFLG